MLGQGNGIVDAALLMTTKVQLATRRQMTMELLKYFLKIWLMPPVVDDDNAVDKERDTRREESVFKQEEMIRSSIIQGESRRGVIGSSLGAISSVRGLTGHLAMVQNTLGQILDTVDG